MIKVVKRMEGTRLNVCYLSEAGKLLPARDQGTRAGHAMTLACDMSLFNHSLWRKNNMLNESWLDYD